MNWQFDNKTQDKIARKNQQKCNQTLGNKRKDWTTEIVSRLPGLLSNKKQKTKIKQANWLKDKLKRPKIKKKIN